MEGKGVFYIVIGKLLELFEGCAVCSARPVALKQRGNARATPNFPVDIVYTWVNGSDPRYIEKKRLHESRWESPRTESIAHARFRDNSELMYSLRSVEKYAPWVNNIYIVTDGQLPSWLNRKNRRIHIVDHKEIIPEIFLPTFNSHVIECYLHRIPGLSENYVYFNDDFLLTNDCSKSDFFTSNGLPYIFCDWRGSRLSGYKKKSTSHAASFFNVINYVKRNLNVKLVDIIAAHVPYPMSRTLALHVYDFFYAAIQGFSSNKFREMNEMAFYCHAAPLFAFIRKEGVPCDTNYYYINVKRLDRKLYYNTLLTNKPFAPLFICVNEVPGRMPTFLWKNELQRFLSRIFPLQSDFEL